MANRHYGEIGDIWKHLPLAAILQVEQLAAVWESHAGSAHYPLTHTPARDYGVFTFLEHAAANPLLGSSRYAGLLAEYARQEIYPGSPLLALRLAPEASFIFCDLDSDSLHSIEIAANTLHLPPHAVSTFQQDGISTLAEAAAKLTPEMAAGTLAHIDPYHPLEPGSNGLSSVDLFCDLGRRGFKIVLWYGYVSAAHRQQLKAGMRAALDRVSMPYWRGEIMLDVLDDPTFELNPGVLGCGLLCANLSAASITACNQLGNALADLYAPVTFSSGHSGALRFEAESH